MKALNLHYGVCYIFVICYTVALGFGSGLEIVAAGRKQIGITVAYDSSYTSLAYPGGDAPRKLGVCTDVVIRAFRGALSVDLQLLVHEDMSKTFSQYPQLWNLKKPDPNIDHRRVPNLQKFFTRRGCTIRVNGNKGCDDFMPGDIVTVTVPPHLPHIMLVSDKKSATGCPLVIHNIGNGTQEEDRLFTYEHTGHYRWK